MKVLYFNYEDEKLIMTQEDGPVPQMGNLIQVQETNVWYEVVDICLYQGDVEIYVNQIESR